MTTRRNFLKVLGASSLLSPSLWKHYARPTPGMVIVHRGARYRSLVAKEPMAAGTIASSDGTHAFPCTNWRSRPAGVVPHDVKRGEQFLAVTSGSIEVRV